MIREVLLLKFVFVLYLKVFFTGRMAERLLVSKRPIWGPNAMIAMQLEGMFFFFSPCNAALTQI